MWAEVSPDGALIWTSSNEQGVPTYPPLNGTLLHFAPAAGA